jgi:outer membrane protein TolC
VRSAAAALAAARKAAAALGEAAPLKARATAETLKHNNYMLLGYDRLLEAKRRELEAHAAHADALAEYWTRRAELERASGGRLPIIEEKP